MTSKRSSWVTTRRGAPAVSLSIGGVGRAEVVLVVVRSNVVARAIVRSIIVVIFAVVNILLSIYQKKKIMMMMPFGFDE